MSGVSKNVTNTSASSNSSKNEWSLTSVLPVYKLEYTDGTNWFEVATENFVNVIVKAPCIAATTGTALDAAYLSGTAGVGATLTQVGTPYGPLVIDGVTLSLGQRVLIKDQGADVPANASQNGIYVLTTLGVDPGTQWVLTRATDCDSPYIINPGDTVVIAQGAINGVTSWMQNATVTTVGTSVINYSSLSKIGVASVTGTPNQIAVNNTDPTAPVVALATNPIIPGTEGMGLPGGTAAERTVSAPGTLRYWTGV